MYSGISDFYNEFTCDIDYDGLAGVIDGIVSESEAGKMYVREGKAPLLLDCACGTGTLTAKLSDIGYDCIGLDISEDMLNVARDNFADKNILWICQDMCKMDLYGSIAAVVCITDSVNHILKRDRLDSFFGRAHNFLDPGGVFVFDVLTEKHFTGKEENLTFFADYDDASCFWNGRYNRKSKICTYDISCFSLGEEGLYERFDDRIREKVWDGDEIRNSLMEAGFRKITAKSGRTVMPGKSGKDRLYYICVK